MSRRAADRSATSVIVLAGGRASRFGGDKLAADLAGHAVLDRTIETARTLAEEVLVVGRHDRTAGVIELPDDVPFQGPLAALATGLRRASGDLVVVLAGDMAIARADVLRLLLEQIAPPGRSPAAALEQAGAAQPLPLAVRRREGRQAAGAALEAGQRSLRALLDRLDVAVVPEGRWRAVDPTADTLLDVDTPADLARARARLEPGG